MPRYWLKQQQCRNTSLKAVFLTWERLNRIVKIPSDQMLPEKLSVCRLKKATVFRREQRLRRSMTKCCNYNWKTQKFPLKDNKTMINVIPTLKKRMRKPAFRAKKQNWACVL